MRIVEWVVGGLAVVVVILGLAWVMVPKEWIINFALNQVQAQTGRDVTVEAHRDVYEKEIDAFGTVFTIVSMQKIGTSAIQSRATAGVAGGTYLFALPGSPGACRDAWDEILEKQLDFRHRPCNFVEIMSRLDEYLRRK